MAGVAERVLFVATVALLRVIHRLYGMNTDEVATMVLGLVIPTGVGQVQVFTRPSTLMAIQAPSLIMAFSAVVAGFAGQNPVMPHEISFVIRGDSFPLVAVITFLDCHPRVFLVCHLLRKR